MDISHWCLWSVLRNNTVYCQDHIESVIQEWTSTECWWNDDKGRPKYIKKNSPNFVNNKCHMGSYGNKTRPLPWGWPTNQLSHSKTLTIQNTMSTCQCKKHSRLWKAAVSSHDQIDVIHHIDQQVFINIRETCCSIFRVQNVEIGIWADNVGWVGEMDHKDGRLAICSRMEKGPNIRCRAEESE